MNHNLDICTLLKFDIVRVSGFVMKLQFVYSVHAWIPHIAVLLAAVHNFSIHTV